MFENICVILLACVVAWFGIRTLRLGGVISVVVGMGWVRLTFRSRDRTKPTERQG